MASSSQYHTISVKVSQKNVLAHRLGTHGPDFHTKPQSKNWKLRRLPRKISLYK